MKRVINAIIHFVAFIIGYNLPELKESGINKKPTMLRLGDK